MHSKNEIQKNLIEKVNEKEKRNKGIRPLQGLFHSNTRKQVHRKYYPFASYTSNFYLPKRIERDLLTRILANLQKVNFISTLNHVTNQAYID